MTDEIINQVIQEAKASAQPIEESKQPAQAAQATEEVTTTDESTTEAKEAVDAKEATDGKEPDDVVFPKKAINALSRRDKQIGKLQAQLAAERAELQALREKANQSAKPQNLPKEDDFDNYGDYLKAVARSEFEQEASQKAQQTQEQRLKETEQRWVDERTAYATEKAQEAVKQIPNLPQLITENADIVSEFNPFIERAFLEADEPVLAFYALAQEGKLEAIAKMSPARAAIEIGKAEIRGAELVKTKPITKAPAPIESLKGTGSGSKSLDNMNHKELLKWLES